MDTLVGMETTVGKVTSEVVGMQEANKRWVLNMELNFCHRKKRTSLDKKSLLMHKQTKPSLHLLCVRNGTPGDGRDIGKELGKVSPIISLVTNPERPQANPCIAFQGLLGLLFEIL